MRRSKGAVAQRLRDLSSIVEALGYLCKQRFEVGAERIECLGGQRVFDDEIALAVKRIDLCRTQLHSYSLSKAVLRAASTSSAAIQPRAIQRARSSQLSTRLGKELACRRRRWAKSSCSASSI
jgi:hypothetical protein